MVNALEIARLAVSYGGRAAVREVSLTIAPGEIVALIGESGSGKTSVAHAALRLLPGEADWTGAVRIDGVDLAGLDERALGAVRGGRVGMVIQEPATALDPVMTIGRQIGEAITPHRRLSRVELRYAIAELLARVGLKVPPSRYPHQLSGGQRQRVAIAIAIAIAAGPALLIADEPTAALDPPTRARIVALLVDLVRERGMALLLVTHDLALAASIADRLVVIDDGRIVESGSPALLLAAPASAPLRIQRDAALWRPERGVRVAGAPLLTIEGVRQSYARGIGFLGGTPTVALDDVGFTLACGETLGVVGESGSGKSTLARIVLGLDRPEAGRVLLDGRPLDGSARQRRLVQAVFQDPAASFDPRYSVGRIVAEPLHLLDANPMAAERDALVAGALGAVGLAAEMAARLPHELSGGQRQRVAIARALVLKPALVVLDEAVSALDAGLRADVLALLDRLQRERGLAYLFVSHDIGTMRAIADRLLVLQGGRIVEQGATAEVLAHPRDPFTRALVAAELRLDDS